MQQKVFQIKIMLIVLFKTVATFPPPLLTGRKWFRTDLSNLSGRTSAGGNKWRVLFSRDWKHAAILPHCSTVVAMHKRPHTRLKMVAIGPTHNDFHTMWKNKLEKET